MVIACYDLTLQRKKKPVLNLGTGLGKCVVCCFFSENNLALRLYSYFCNIFNPK